MKIYIEQSISRGMRRDKSFNIINDKNVLYTSPFRSYININIKDDMEKLRKLMSNNYQLKIFDTKSKNTRNISINELKLNENDSIQYRLCRASEVKVSNRPPARTNNQPLVQRNILEIPERNNFNFSEVVEDLKLIRERDRLERLGFRRLPNESDRNISISYLCDSHYTQVFSYKFNGNRQTMSQVDAVFDTGNASHTLIDNRIVEEFGFKKFPILATKSQISSFNRIIDIINDIQNSFIASIPKATNRNRFFSGLSNKGIRFIDNPLQYKISLISQDYEGVSGFPNKKQSYNRLRKFSTYKRIKIEFLLNFVQENKKLIKLLMKHPELSDSELYSFCGIPYASGVGGAITVFTEEVIIPFSIDGITNNGELKKYYLTAGVIYNDENKKENKHILFSNDDIDKLSYVGINIGKCAVFSEFRKRISNLIKQKEELSLFLSLTDRTNLPSLSTNIRRDIEIDIAELNSQIDGVGYLPPQEYRHV